MSTDAYVVVTLEIHREQNQWLGRCVELGTATFGDSVDEVAEELADLVALHLNGLEDAGELERFFANHDITMYRDHIPQTVARTVTISDEPAFTQLRPMLIDASHGHSEAALA